MVCAAFVNDVLQDFRGEFGVWLSVSEEGVDGLDVTCDWCRWMVEGEVQWELKLPADGDDTADNVGAVDSAAVPGVGGALRCFDKDLVRTAVIRCNGYCFVEVSKESFDANCLMVSSGSWVKSETKNFHHVFK